MVDPARHDDDRLHGQPHHAAEDELDQILRQAGTAKRSGPAPSAPSPASPSSAQRAAGAQNAARLESQMRAPQTLRLADLGEDQPSADRTPTLKLVSMALAPVALALWLIAPKGVLASRHPAIPPAFKEASARWMLGVTMQRIQRFESEQRRLPATLDELDPTLSDVVTYQRLVEGGCSLETTGPEGTITLQMNRFQPPFLARAAEQIRQSPGATE